MGLVTSSPGSGAPSEERHPPHSGPVASTNPVSATPASSPLNAFRDQIASGATGAGPSSHFSRTVDSAARADPFGAFDAAFGIADLHRRHDALNRIIGSWAASDPDGALAAVESVGNLALRRDLFRSATRSLADTDPLAALAVLGAYPGFDDDGSWSRAFGNLARSDPDGAMAARSSVEDPDVKRRALRSITRELASADLEDTLAWATTLADGADRDGALAELIEAASRTSPAFAAGALAGFEGEPAAASKLAMRVAAEWAGAEPDRALDWAGSLPDGLRDHALGQIADRVFEHDPQRAEEILLDVSDPTIRANVIEKSASLRMSADPEAAISWIVGLDPVDQARAWQAAARSWSHTDPELAAAFAAQTDSSTARNALVGAVANAWTRRDPSAAAGWANSLPDDIRAKALGQVIDQWAHDSPEDAIGFAAATGDPELDRSLTRRTVGRWASRNPEDAAAWVAANPVQPNGASASPDLYREVAGQWLRRDPHQASSWVAGLPAGPYRDAAAASLASGVAGVDPEAAAAWADSITDPSLRQASLKQVVRQLKKSGGRR